MSASFAQISIMWHILWDRRMLNDPASLFNNVMVRRSLSILAIVGGIGWFFSWIVVLLSVSNSILVFDDGSSFFSFAYLIPIFIILSVRLILSLRLTNHFCSVLALVIFSSWR